MSVVAERSRMEKGSFREGQRQRFEQNRRLLALIGERFPDGPRIHGISTKEVFLDTLGWRFASSAEYLALEGGLHLCDLPEVCQKFPLSRLEARALVALLVIEDHVTGYGDEYSRIFPVEGEINPMRLRANRRFRSAAADWISEETSHADGALITVVCSNAADVCSDADPARLMNRLDAAAALPYRAYSHDPAALFVYTAAQERATEIYYAALRANISNPIVAALLERMRSQEARHCALFSKFVRRGLEQRQQDTIDAIQDLLTDGNFRMPLAAMLEDYRRLAVWMCRSAPGYSALQGLETLRIQVRKVATARSSVRDHPVHQLLDMMTAQAF